ncbi:MAG: CTP synthase [Holosporales bacterium]|jgi:CTP synthase|nr:CTP synthase [Holosporales bacterium]
MNDFLYVDEPRYIFITGGVMSSLGKGLSAACLGALLQARGFSVCIKKLDLYINIDPGTLSPYQHGEVFVTEDGTEADLDLGHYERYTGQNTGKQNYLTAGVVYSNLIQKERRGEYLGVTVQVIPHVTDEIKRFITQDGGLFDFVIIELGGTVGDIEGGPFLEAVRQLRNEFGQPQTMFVHLTYVPNMRATNEQKTKPTQHSVKDLLHAGIQPDLILCRTELTLQESTKRKISLFCNIPPDDVIAAQDETNLYKLPLNYSKEGLDERVCLHFGLSHKRHKISEDWLQKWQVLNASLERPLAEVNVVIVGKYVEMEDSYKSLKEALVHAGGKHKTKVNIKWCNAETTVDIVEALKGAEAIIVPGGFGNRGIENKINAIRYARENNVPFLGICLGMQLAIVEAMRNIGGIEDANSTEFTRDCSPVICLMSEWNDDGGNTVVRSEESDIGGTMRLGAYKCQLLEGSLVEDVYGVSIISERHRHRYEFNSRRFGEKLEQTGTFMVGKSPDGSLVEIVERRDHTWFVGVQFHPEFKSKPLSPHPLFDSLIGKIAKKQFLL